MTNSKDNSNTLECWVSISTWQIPNKIPRDWNAEVSDFNMTKFQKTWMVRLVFQHDNSEHFGMSFVDHEVCVCKRGRTICVKASHWLRNPRKCSVCDPANIHIQVLVTNFFPTPPIKLKLELQSTSRWETTQLGQSNYLPDQKQGRINKYNLTVFMRLLQGWLWKVVVLFRASAVFHWILLMNLIQDF